MKVLVTGTRGQLARALAEQMPIGAVRSFVFAGRPDFDLEKPASITATLEAVRPAVVVSAAAFTDVEGAEDDPDRAFRINERGIGELATACQMIGARLIHISTDFVFDGLKGAPYVEDDLVNPLSAYGASKAAGEIEVRNRLPDHVIVRSSWVYSPVGKNFVTTMLALAASRPRLTVVDDQNGNPTSALDLAYAILTILRQWEENPSCGLGQTFHVAGGGQTTWCGFAKAIFEVSDRHGGPTTEVRPIRSEDWPAKARRPHNSALNCRKFEELFHWTAPQWRLSLDPVVSQLVRESRLLSHGAASMKGEREC